ncbi:hypothetical protein MJ699_12705 [Klebsiella pneumoniae]|nr:hypothetical protein MJ699_12705 [Klebsiella pneumoniae]
MGTLKINMHKDFVTARSMIPADNRGSIFGQPDAAACGLPFLDNVREDMRTLWRLIASFFKWT